MYKVIFTASSVLENINQKKILSLIGSLFTIPLTQFYLEVETNFKKSIWYLLINGQFA